MAVGREGPPASPADSIPKSARLVNADDEMTQERYALDLETVLAIAERGWALHPLVPGKKSPATKHGFKDATTDPGQLEAWWAERNDLGWGTPTGTVADIDRADQLDIDLPEDAVQETPSGGRHVLMAPTDRRLPGKLPGEAGEWRPDGKAYVKIYDPDLFLDWDPAELPEVPDEAFAADTSVERGEGEALELTTREELISLVGSLRSDGLEPDDILMVLRSMKDDGRIYDSDTSDPWTDRDFRQLASEAGKWKRGEVIGAPRVNGGEEEAGSFLEFEWLADIPEEDPKPLLLDRLHPDELTILFGDGGTGKGVLAAWWAARLAKNGMRILVIDYEQHTRYEWRPRVRRFGEPDDVDAVLSRVAVVQPQHEIWKAAPTIRAFCEAQQIDYVILDSILYAVGNEEAEKATTAMKVTAAYQEIGLPMLALAHTTKADADPRHPFGSVFWSNSARVTMSFVGQGSKPRVLTMKKTNQKAAFGSVEYDWEWTATETQPPITLEEREHSVNRINKIASMIGHSWTTTAAIVDLLQASGDDAVTEATVRGQLNEHLRKCRETGSRPMVEKQREARATMWRSATYGAGDVTGTRE